MFVYVCLTKFYVLICLPLCMFPLYLSVYLSSSIYLSVYIHISNVCVCIYIYICMYVVYTYTCVYVRPLFMYLHGSVGNVYACMLVSGTCYLQFTRVDRILLVQHASHSWSGCWEHVFPTQVVYNPYNHAFPWFGIRWHHVTRFRAWLSILEAASKFNVKL